MTKIEALDDIFYDGKVRKKGEQMKAASEEDVRKLVGWGKFKVVKTESQKQDEAELPTYETKEELPEESRKRKYMRRDMRPKEES